MADRAGTPNFVRFPYRYDDEGYPLCRVCGIKLDNKRRTFCSPRCVRDFKMLTDWERIRRVIYERDGGICMKCGEKVSKDDFHVDHIIPICAGGSEWDLNNLELSCPPCNLTKGAKMEVEVHV
jgi:5-methylcytosine-specific restriction endonuclease McrA